MTSKEEKRARIIWAQDNVTPAKDRLISTMYELEAVGAIREAKSLGTIIGNLEAWQHKGR